MTASKKIWVDHYLKLSHWLEHKIENQFEVSHLVEKMTKLWADLA